MELFVEGDAKDLRGILCGQDSVRGRSRVEYVDEADGLRVVVESGDVNAARAAVNSHLLLLKTVEKVDEKWKYLRK